MLLLGLSVFACCLIVQAAYLWRFAAGFRHAEREVPAPDEGACPSISVVIAARNEERDLPLLLDALAAQTHPHFEAIICNDGSEDGTAEVVRNYQTQAPWLRLLDVMDRQAPYKKHALTQGIAAAQHDLLALTDADSVPAPGWLEHLARVHAAADRPALLTGYAHVPVRPGLLNRLIRYERLLTTFATAATIGLGRPYMARGCNISYPKTLFEAVGGFAHSAQSMSGDDDLLVQHIARERAAPIYHLFAPDSFVGTDAASTWRQWIRQKLRHTSAGRFYDTGIQRHLAVFHISHLVLWLAPALLGAWGLGLLAARLVLLGVTLMAPARRFQSADLLLWVPLLEFLYALYNVFVATTGVLRPPKRW
ncbi:MAG: glycosyltransferase [Bacteroidota bacterium]